MMENEQVQHMLEMAEKALRVVETHAPVVIDEIIRFGIWNNAIGLTFGILCLAIAGWCLRRVFKGLDSDIEEAKLVYAAAAVCCGFMGAALSIQNGFYLCMVLIAPHFYVIDQLT